MFSRHVPFCPAHFNQSYILKYTTIAISSSLGLSASVTSLLLEATFRCYIETNTFVRFLPSIIIFHVLFDGLAPLQSSSPKCWYRSSDVLVFIVAHPILGSFNLLAVRPFSLIRFFLRTFNVVVFQCGVVLCTGTIVDLLPLLHKKNLFCFPRYAFPG